jgi:hypothetical protein
MWYLRSNNHVTLVREESHAVEDLCLLESSALTCMALAEESVRGRPQKVGGPETVRYKIDSDCDRLMPSSKRKLMIRQSLLLVVVSCALERLAAVSLRALV